MYDRLNPHIYTEEMRTKLIKQIEGERILDVGVGTGYTSRDVKNAVGIDISQKMLSRAKDYHGSLIVADALHPPFKLESFDTIICAGSLYYLPKPAEGLKIFHSLLRRNGIVLYLGPNIKLVAFWVRVYDETKLEGLFGLAGFKVEKIMKIGWRGIAYLAKARKSE
jgi:ubiquinone/menaquinone biosynthesis C-methylase UbiE